MTRGKISQRGETLKFTTSAKSGSRCDRVPPLIQDGALGDCHVLSMSASSKWVGNCGGQTQAIGEMVGFSYPQISTGQAVQAG